MDALELGEGGRQDDVEVLRADRVRNREVDDLRMRAEAAAFEEPIRNDDCPDDGVVDEHEQIEAGTGRDPERRHRPYEGRGCEAEDAIVRADEGAGPRSEEHTSELQ